MREVYVATVKKPHPVNTTTDFIGAYATLDDAKKAVEENLTHTGSQLVTWRHDPDLLRYTAKLDGGTMNNPYGVIDYTIV